MAAAGQIQAMIKEKWKNSLRSPLFWFATVVAPLACCLFFTSLMKSGLPAEMPIGLVDEDATATSREIGRNLDAFQHVRLAGRYASVAEARKAMQQGDIYGFYLIPRHTARRAQRGEVPTVSFYTNYSYLVAGSLIYKDMRTMAELSSGAAARSVLYARGATERLAMAYLQPIVIDVNPIGNPWLNYSVYLSNTLVPGVLCLFVLLLTGYTLGADFKAGRARTALERCGGSVFRLLFAQLLPQTVAFLLTGGLIVLILYGVLRYPCFCGIPTMLLVVSLLVLAAQGLGIAIFSLLPTQRMAMSGGALLGVVSFSICGMSFPVMAMHPALQGLALLSPLRHYFLLYVNCALDGYSLLNAWPYVVALLLMALLPLPVAPLLRKAFLRYGYEP
ncbi:MAG: ABC transporter permease [Alloprevotella sp.]